MGMHLAFGIKSASAVSIALSKPEEQEILMTTIFT